MEIWKPIPGYENYYQVSNYGNIKSLPRILKNGYATYLSKEKLLTPKKNSTGYLWVKLCIGNEKSFSVHRLVMLAFIGKSDLIVNHKDLDKTNNKLDNLEYCTIKENVYHYEKSIKRSSKFIGVSYDITRKKWTAKYKKNKKTINLGRFNSEIEAYNAIKPYINAPTRLSN